MSIATKLNQIILAKEDIKDAIEAKGGTVGTTFASYATAIENLPSSGGGGDTDWSILGFNSTPTAITTQMNLFSNWDNLTENLKKLIISSNRLKIIFFGKDLNDITSLSLLFINCSELIEARITGLKGNVDSFFSGCSALEYLNTLDMQNVTSASTMFYSCSKIQQPVLINTQNITNFINMFGYCSNLISISIDLSGATSAALMFLSCKSLGTVNILGTFNENMTDLSNMFFNCNALVNVTLPSTANVQNFSSIFWGCSLLRGTITLDCSNATNMQSAFANTSKLNEVNLVDTSKVTNFKEIFYSSNIDKVTGLDFSSVAGVSGTNIVGSYNSYIKNALIKNIGKTISPAFTLSFVKMVDWGMDSSGTIYGGTDNWKTVRDTLLTYSFDRATAGYDTCTIGLSSSTKALFNDRNYFTEADIAEITAKGYTIA